VGVLGLGIAQKACEQQLARRGFEEIVPSDHLPDLLVGVVHDHREVVGVGAVPAAKDEVVHHAIDLPMQPVYEGDAFRPSIEAEGGGPHGGPFTLRAFACG